MSVFYQHDDKELINFNEISREQLVKLYNDDYDRFMDFMDNLSQKDTENYIKLLSLFTKDTYVYLNYCFLNNDIRINEKEFFEKFETIEDNESLELFVLNNCDDLIDFGMYFMTNNPLYKTRCFLELKEEQNQKICELYPSHLLDLQAYTEDVGVNKIIDYYHYLKDENNDRFTNLMIAKDVFEYLEYLSEKNQYLFEKTIGEIRNKIYKWNRYVIDNSNKDILEYEQEFIGYLENKDALELGELALENPNILNEMLFQLFDYEIDKCEVFIDELGNSVKVTEDEVDEYMESIGKKKI